MGRHRIVIAFLGILLPSGIAYAQEAQAPAKPIYDVPSFGKPDRLVDIGGRRMNLHCIGAGSPIVVFDAGGGSWSLDWVSVQPEIAKITRACSYDRAGLGFSDPSYRPATSLDAARDLHALLHHAGESAPYVLVGHSLGGLDIRLFADLYRDEVAGMVQVDGANEDWDKRSRVTLGPVYDRKYNNPGQFRKFLSDCMAAAKSGSGADSNGYPKCMGGARSWLSPRLNDSMAAIYSKPSFYAAVLAEDRNRERSRDQGRAYRRSYGDLPLIVLISTKSASNVSADDSEKFYRVGSELGGQLALLSSRGILRSVPNAGHYIHHDRPDAVISAIREVWGQASGR